MHYAARRVINTGRPSEVYSVIPGPDCTISNNCVRLRHLCIADGGFAPDIVMAITYKEFTCSHATVAFVLPDPPTLMY